MGKCGKFWSYVHHLDLSVFVRYASNWLHQMAVRGEIRKATDRKRKGQSRKQPSVTVMKRSLSAKPAPLGGKLLLLGDTKEQATCCIITDDNLNRKGEENFLPPQ